MTLSQSTLVQRIRYELMAGEPTDWEDSSCSASSASSTITGATAAYWDKGDVGEFIEDGDTFLTISLSGTTITGTRSYDGSTGASHASARVLKNPRYRFNVIVNAISAVIQDQLWPKAWKSVSDTFTPPTTNQTITWNDIGTTGDARGLILVSQSYGTASERLGFYGERHSPRPVQFRRNLPSGVVTNLQGVLFPGGFYHATNTVNVLYASKITDTVSSGNYSDLTDGDAVVEAIIYGAVSHLESALENRKPRQPRQDRETLRGASLFDRRFRNALNRAEQECRDTIPIMTRWSHGR